MVFFFSDIWPLRTKIGIYLNVYRELDQDFGNLRLKQILSECTKAEFIAKCKYGIQILALGIISKLDNIKNGKNVGHKHSTQYLLLKYLEIYWSDEYSEFRKYVEEKTNCEDIGMNFLAYE